MQCVNGKNTIQLQSPLPFKKGTLVWIEKSSSIDLGIKISSFSDYYSNATGKRKIIRMPNQQIMFSITTEFHFVYKRVTEPTEPSTEFRGYWSAGIVCNDETFEKAQQLIIFTICKFFTKLIF